MWAISVSSGDPTNGVSSSFCLPPAQSAAPLRRRTAPPPRLTGRRVTPSPRLSAAAYTNEGWW